MIGGDSSWLQWRRLIPAIGSSVDSVVGRTGFAAKGLVSQWCGWMRSGGAVEFVVTTPEKVGRTLQGVSELVGSVGKMIYRHGVGKK